MSEEEWAALLVQRGLFTTWRSALADAIAKAIVGNTAKGGVTDVDAAAAMAADQVMDRLADALDDVAGILADDQLARIGGRVKQVVDDRVTTGATS